MVRQLCRTPVIGVQGCQYLRAVLFPVHALPCRVPRAHVHTPDRITASELGPAAGVWLKGGT